MQVTWLFPDTSKCNKHRKPERDEDEPSWRRYQQSKQRPALTTRPAVFRYF